MISGKVEKGNVQISIQGSVNVIAAEVCCLIRAIYKSMAQKDHKYAERFKEIVFREANGDKMFSDKSDKFDDDESLDVEDKHEDKDEEERDNQFDGLKKLLEHLEKLKGMLEDED